jgi:hypothetical protein
MLTSKNEVHDESKRKIISRNVRHYSVRKHNIPSIFQNDKDKDIQNNSASFTCGCEKKWFLLGKNVTCLLKQGYENTWTHEG